MVDALCLDDLDQFGTELDDPLAELYQDLYHRIIEPPGSNIDDPNRGFGLEGKLSAGVRHGGIAPWIKVGLENELRKDDRVRDVRATITDTGNGECRIEIAVVADEGKIGITLVSDGTGVRRVT